MLQFIFGKAASGKTHLVHEMIKKEALAGKKNLILLVPEQNTFETEKQMLGLLGGGFMSMVEVLSFTRMCETAGQLYGGVAGVRVSDAERMILMGKALKGLAPHLEMFKKYVSSPTFIKQMASVIGEFKTAGISSDVLMKTSGEVKSSTLSTKLSEIAMVYSSYDALLKGVYIDPLDELDNFYSKAAEHGFFKGKTVYIDAFKGFTGQQMKILKIMITSAERVIITFCTDGEDKFDGSGVFSNICATAERLKKYALDHNIEVAEPIKLTESYFACDEILNLEKLLSGNVGIKYEEPTENITLGSFETPLKEIEYVFRTIHRLVRTEEYNFKDFVIIARDITKYERRIAAASRKFNTPCYFDKRRGLMASPLARFVLSLLKAARDFSSESILSLIKTGFFGFSDEEIVAIEEYVFVWDISGNSWTGEWKMNPFGFSSVREYQEEKIRAELERLNDLRQKIVKPLMSLKHSFKGNVTDITKCLYDTLMSMEVNLTVKRSCDKLFADGRIDDVDFISASWDEVIKMFDNMVRCYGEEIITPLEYTDMLELAFGGCTVGSIPRMIDEVSCGSADRIRPARPKIVFVIGMNLGEFPSRANDSGILLRTDRVILEEMGMDISDRFRKYAVDENFLCYSAVCSATERVFVSRHNFGFDGTKCEESPIFTKIKNSFENCKYISGEDDCLPETSEEGFGIYAAGRKNGDPLSLALGEIYKDSLDYSARAEALERTEERIARRVSKENCDLLFKGDLKLSASKIEVYNKCPLSYFCSYVLGIKRLQKAELDSLQRGTVAHYVLERVLSELKEDIATASKEVISHLVEKAMTDYLETVSGSDYLSSPAFRFAYEEIGRMMKYLLEHIAREFKNSDFIPKAFELTIDSKEGDIPSLVLEFMPEKKTELTGQIDRVDVYKDTCGKEFVRIVDYKTGAKAFHLSDAFYGQNLQMLIYLYVLRQSEKSEYSKMEPAGILYMPAKRGMKTTSNPSPLQMNGMLLDDADILRAMDKEGIGEFVFKKSTRGRVTDPVISAEDFETVFSYVEYAIKNTAKNISSGIFDLCPRDGVDNNACDYCDFKCVCGVEDDFEHQKPDIVDPKATIEKMKEVTENEMD